MKRTGQQTVRTFILINNILSSLRRQGSILSVILILSLVFSVAGCENKPAGKAKSEKPILLTGVQKQANFKLAEAQTLLLKNKKHPEFSTASKLLQFANEHYSKGSYKKSLELSTHCISILSESPDKRIIP